MLGRCGWDRVAACVADIMAAQPKQNLLPTPDLSLPYPTSGNWAYSASSSACIQVILFSVSVIDGVHEAYRCPEMPG